MREFIYTPESIEHLGDNVWVRIWTSGTSTYASNNNFVLYGEYTPESLKYITDNVYNFVGSSGHADLGTNTSVIFRGVI